ncbi:polycomb group protein VERNALIZATION 2 isoform X1 [Capsella rubella]|uniref:polycomb group protein VERNALIZATION 2 isoform X1 n=1 Tax=Capsella rubella TaxID=81985 RepID=UPI000CD4D6CE|nr:polycomb group protein VERNALIZATION 2 isoform X1 [Capsella rubella]XP_023634372.1 polycomb group protein VERNALIZATION 2 isoform X1 [Capsella rubella]
MCRQNCRAKSSPEEVISTDENLLIYCKPVRLYNIFHLRSLCNPSFLPRCLNYKIGAKRKRKSRSTGMVVFNYKDCNNTLQKTEVREDCSCPFCFMLCGSFKGLQFHLNSSHDLFEFEFKLSEEYQTVNVSVKLNSFIFEEEGSDDDKFEPFSLCSKPRKRRQRGGRNNTRRLKVSFLPLDSPSLANGTENGTSLLTDGNRGLGYPEATELAGQFEMTSNTPPAIAHSSGADAKVVLTSEAVVTATRTKKLSAERSEARSHLLLQKRQFYHSHRVQPMGLEQVMSDRDSEDEVDDDVADFEDRQLQMLDDFVDVNKDEKQFMHLWNSFVRKQRVIADGHISWACEAFSRFYEKELHSYSSLFWCWRLFLIKLWNHGLVDAATINNCSTILENCRNSSDTNNNNIADHPNDMNNINIDNDDHNCRDK